MGLMQRVQLAGAVLRGKVSSSWNWRSGVRPGSIFNGSKLSGKKLYPSAFDFDSETLRDSCRAAYWDSTQARAIITRLVDNVIGSGMFLEYQPEWDLIPTAVKEERRDTFINDVEKRFHLWAMSKEPDAAAAQTLYELQGYEFLNRLRDGETFAVLRFSGDSSRMNPLNIQFIDPSQVQTPWDKPTLSVVKDTGARVEDGIEIDANGREIAIHVLDPLTGKTTRIPVMGSGSGRRFVIHARTFDTMGAVRGISVLGPVLHELKKIADYSVAELEAAVVNAVLSLWVKPSQTSNASAALTGIRTRGGNDRGQTVDQDYRETKFDRGGLIVQSLKAGEEVVSFDTKRPNVNFEAFVRAVTKHISASVGMPIEVLEESFNANYSASRASLLLFWNTVEKWRLSGATQFLNEIFAAWFREEVKAKRIDAPGFGGSSAYVNAAWLSCDWMGKGKPSIDPKKEAEAVQLRIKMGHTTGEREAIQYNNSDFSENVRRLKIENESLPGESPEGQRKEAG